MADEVIDIMAQIELALLENLTDSLASGDWRSARARAFLEYQARNTDIIGRFDIPSALNTELWNTYREAGVKTRKDLAKNAASGGFQGDTTFRVNEAKMNALVQEYIGKFNEVQSSILRRTDDIYRQSIFKAQASLATDLYTLDECVDMAVKDFVAAGINSVMYSNGSRHSITDYSEMALRTGNRRATLWGEGAARGELGQYLVLVTQYGGCSDTCLPWQGRVYFDDVYSGGMPSMNTTNQTLLSEAISNGLFHPRCRHSSNTYYEGVTEIPELMDAEEALEVSKLQDEQAKNERYIRAYKRLEHTAQSEKYKNYYGRKVNEWQTKNREFVDSHPQLRRRYKRERLELDASGSEQVGLAAKLVANLD